MYQCELCGSIFPTPVKEMSAADDYLGLVKSEAVDVCPGCGCPFFYPYDGEDDIDH